MGYCGDWLRCRGSVSVSYYCCHCFCCGCYCCYDHYHFWVIFLSRMIFGVSQKCIT